MSPARLNELRRQRDTVQAHLDWLDAKIARESGTVEPPPAALPRFAAPGPLPETSAAIPDYEPDPVSAAADARRGCLIWFLVLLVLTAAAITALYFWRYRDHPLLFAPTDQAARVPSIIRIT